MSEGIMKIKVPGKLMIAGEYAILEENQHAIVVAVDRYVTAEIARSVENTLSLPELRLSNITWKNSGDEPVFSYSSSQLSFIRSVIKLTNQFFRERGIHRENGRLTITSDLVDKDGRKYGLGSSAAITVAAAAAILSFNHVRLTKEEIFKLSALSHLKTQGNGSGADIATAVFGGWIDYSAFQAEWVLNELEKGTEVCEIIKKPWPNLSISSITPPPQLELCVGWTGAAAETGPMVAKIQRLRLAEPQKYEQFLEESSKAVARVVKGFAEGNADLVLGGISQNRAALRELGKSVNVSIETPKLKVLCDVGEQFGRAKPSGAGGGDCGIAFIQRREQKPKLHDAWQKEGITPLNLKTSPNGLTMV